MWIALPNSFLSIVAPDTALTGPRLLVRARAAGDLERIFPTAKVTHTPDADYAYRTTLPRTDVAQALAAAVAAIDYPNFKDAVPEPDRHDAYEAAWFVMRAFQQNRTRARSPKFPQSRRPR